MSVVNLKSERFVREFVKYRRLKHAFRDDLINLIVRHLDWDRGCTPSMIINELVDAARFIKREPPPPYDKRESK